MISAQTSSYRQFLANVVKVDFLPVGRVQERDSRPPEVVRAASDPGGLAFRLGQDARSPSRDFLGFDHSDDLTIEEQSVILEQSSLYGQFDWNVPLHDGANQTARETRLAVFLCPSDTVSDTGFVEMGSWPERYAMASYAACFGPPDLDAVQEQRDGMFSRNSRTRFADVTDGLSQTLMIGERENGPFRRAGSHGVHFSYETT